MGRWAARNGMRYKVPTALEAFFFGRGIDRITYSLKIKPITRCDVFDAVDGVARLEWVQRMMFGFLGHLKLYLQKRIRRHEVIEEIS
jgi:hypothetical protein